MSIKSLDDCCYVNWYCEFHITLALFLSHLTFCSLLYVGVNSVALEGEKKDKVVIIGEAVDAAGITSLLRKKVGHASLELVDEVK